MNPSFQLVESGWEKVVSEALVADRTALRVVSPFIKVRAVERLLSGTVPALIQVITRFHLGEMCDGINDAGALRLLLEHGAKIRGIRNLHAKLYLFGDSRAIVTSANLTEAALTRNHEFGFVAGDREICRNCREYFDSIWAKAGTDLNLARLEKWEQRIERARLSSLKASPTSGLPDEGTNAGLPAPLEVTPPLIEEAPQAFVKFFGKGNFRDEIGTKTINEVKRTGCHWACSYPKGKRPRQVESGAVIFMARLVKPNDSIIFGRAVALKHVQGRDDATPEEVRLIPFKKKWSHYIRVHHAEFVAGTFENGVSLRMFEAELKSNAYATTQRNALEGAGNTDPRHAYRQQPAVQLTKEGFAWLNRRLEQAFAKHGRLTPADLDKLTGPDARHDSVSLPPVKAQPLLRALVGVLNDGTVDVRNPKTFPSYKDILAAMGVSPWEGARLGPQFAREGGDALNKWLRENELPALTGLVVNRDSSRPGGDYFRSNDRQPDDFGWWLEQVRLCKGFNWTPYLMND
jgi:hypothetical protein